MHQCAHRARCGMKIGAHSRLKDRIVNVRKAPAPRTSGSRLAGERRLPTKRSSSSNLQGVKPPGIQLMIELKMDDALIALAQRPDRYIGCEAYRAGSRPVGPVENARVTRSGDLHLRPALSVTAAAHARRGRGCSVSSIRQSSIMSYQIPLIRTRGPIGAVRWT